MNFHPPVPKLYKPRNLFVAIGPIAAVGKTAGGFQSTPNTAPPTNPIRPVITLYFNVVLFMLTLYHPAAGTTMFAPPGTRLPAVPPQSGSPHAWPARNLNSVPAGRKI